MHGIPIHLAGQLARPRPNEGEGDEPRNGPLGKRAQIRAAMQTGNWQLALRIAARFRDRDKHAAAIQRAHEAYANARFYKQLGKDPERLKEAGKRALVSRYDK